MTVTLTSPVEGKQPGDTYTGPREAWLLANGYASQANYTGVGVANEGPLGLTDVSKDPNLAGNRVANGDEVVALGSLLPAKGTNDGLVTGQVKQQKALSQAGDVARTPEGPASDVKITPATGGVAGGTVVTVKGSGGFDDSTGVTFGGTAGTAFTKVDDETLKVTTPAHAAGSVSVVVVDADGNKTSPTNFVYA